MTDDFSLARGDISKATGLGYRSIKRLITTPYPVFSQKDPAGLRGGGRIERFRLSDVLPRLREHYDYTDEMGQTLIKIDQTYRKAKNL